MLAWFFAAALASSWLFDRAVDAAKWHPVPSAVVFSLGVVVQLVGYVGMFHVLQGSLPFLAKVRRELAAEHRDESDRPGRRDRWGIIEAVRREDDRFLDAVAASLLPLVVFYGAWGLFADDWKALQDGIIRTTDPFKARDHVPELADPRIFLAVAGVVFLVRFAFEARWRRTGGVVAGVLAGTFEGMWMVLALIGISDYVVRLKTWASERRVVDAVLDVPRGIRDGIAGVDIGGGRTLGEVVAPFVPDVSDGIVLPLLWLVIGAVVLGRDMERGVVVAKVHPVARALPRLDRLPPRVRRALALVSAEMREKWVPMVSALGLVLRAGITVFVAYAVAYAAAVVLGDYAQLGVQQLIGPREFEFWTSFDQPLGLLRLAISEPLRIAVIAVSVDTVLRLAVRRRSMDRVSRRGREAAAPAARA